MSFERSVKSAKIQERGEIIESDVFFKNKQEAEKIRTEFNRGNITFECLCCKQDLILSKSKKRTFYLKHYPNSEYCELKDESLDNEEQEIISKALIAKESPRHIFLKNKIGGLLKETIDVSDVKIDDFFIFNTKGEKRKPDVYCKYLDKEIVFEIQLSQLSQKYILGRYDFYKQKGIYLIWILENFDIESNSQTNLDIKHLSTHQNYFRFIDTAKTFQLNCKFKQTFINHRNQFYDKKKEVNISLNRLKFDIHNKEVYFYNFLTNKEELELIQRRNKYKIEKERIAHELETRKEEVAYKVHDFLETVALEKKKGYSSDFNKLKKELEFFKKDEIELLNLRLSINSKKRLIKWIKEGRSRDYNFLKFLLEAESIDINVNQKDELGKSVIWYLFENKDLIQKENYLILFFKRGYLYNSNDDIYLKNKYSNLNDYQLISFICYSANETPKWLIDKLFEYKSQRVLCIIQSCLNNKIFVFRFNSWIALFNYALENFPEYWTFIETALKSSDLYERVLKSDKRGSFRRKLKKIENFDEDDYDREFAHLMMNFYPEIT